MAQWSRADRTLYTKLVYYGPAFGGKTSNLQALHQITDPDGKYKLLSVKTADDRTLFFDLLPFDLGDILGYQVAMKLYTVPGQVRYDTTRQVVLAGADALVFVADSNSSREDQNIWSLQNLLMNMRANRLDPRQVPILYQFNKQDLPEAAPPEEVARWLGIKPEEGFPSVATEGRGVLETFMAACRAMLQQIMAKADERTRAQIDDRALDDHLEKAFRPFMARREVVQPPEPTHPPEAETAAAAAASQMVLNGEDLLERSVRTSVKLGEKLTTETARANRLERESEAFRRLSDSLRAVGASFDKTQIIDTVLTTTAEIVHAPIVTLIHEPEPGRLALERAWGSTEEPLLGFDEGRSLAARIVANGGPCVIDDLAPECGEMEHPRLTNLRALAAVPVDRATGRTMMVYAPKPDGRFSRADVRFLGTVAGHLAAGLEKSRLHDDLAGHRDRLEEMVSDRTEQLRSAYEELRSSEEMKDRFLSNLSHEMKTPLTAILTSAVVLRDYKSTPKERKELIGSIVQGGETLQNQLDGLFRLVNLEKSTEPLKPTLITPRELLDEAHRLAGQPKLRTRVEGMPSELRIDFQRLSRAAANLIDNAVKFSPEGSPITVQIQPSKTDDGAHDFFYLSVLDRGPGIPPEDRERVFQMFEQGGDLMTDKPCGVGIGLHEARLIAEQHGGTIEYRPRPGGGSEFRMSIPMASIDEPVLVEVEA